MSIPIFERLRTQSKPKYNRKNILSIYKPNLEPPSSYKEVENVTTRMESPPVSILPFSLDRSRPVNSPASLKIMRRKKIIVPPSINTFHFSEGKQDEWFYVDSEGIIRGPYKTLEMHKWDIKQYFEDNLLVKRRSDLIFLPISMIFPEISDRFINEPEFPNISFQKKILLYLLEEINGESTVGEESLTTESTMEVFTEDSIIKEVLLKKKKKKKKKNFEELSGTEIENQIEFQSEDISIPPGVEVAEEQEIVLEGYSEDQLIQEMLEIQKKKLEIQSKTQSQKVNLQKQNTKRSNRRRRRRNKHQIQQQQKKQKTQLPEIIEINVNDVLTGDFEKWCLQEITKLGGDISLISLLLTLESNIEIKHYVKETLPGYTNSFISQFLSQLSFRMDEIRNELGLNKTKQKIRVIPNK